MTISYKWLDAEQTVLRLTDTENPGQVKTIPANPENKDYTEYLASGITADAYVAPAAPTPLTPTEKLANTGLTVEELQTLLGL